jgi:hypothetical protein
MSDVAAGSSAALQLQQNMAAAPDVQQTQNLAMQGAQLKLQQDQANLERTKLVNLYGEANFQSSKEARQKLQALTQDPKFKAADDAGKVRMAALLDAQVSGDPEKLAKNLQSAELIESKDLANQSVALNNQAREVTKAAAIVNAVAPEKIGETFDRLPEANRKVVYDQVGGEQAWKTLSNLEKKAVLNNLMMNADRKLAAQAMAIEEEKQKVIAASREKVANISATWHMNNKAAGGSKEELATFRAYVNKNATDNKKFTGSESRLVKAISDAKVLYDGAVLTGNTKAAKEAKSEMDSRTADLNDLRTRQLKSEISNARMLPAGAQRDRIMDELTKQAEVIGIKTDVPKPDTTKKDTSNKNAGSKAQPIAMPTVKSELQSGKYYNTPRGVAKWDGSKFVTE